MSGYIEVSGILNVNIRGMQEELMYLRNEVKILKSENENLKRINSEYMKNDISIISSNMNGLYINKDIN